MQYAFRRNVTCKKKIQWLGIKYIKYTIHNDFVLYKFNRDYIDERVSRSVYNLLCVCLYINNFSNIFWCTWLADNYIVCTLEFQVVGCYNVDGQCTPRQVTVSRRCTNRALRKSECFVIAKYWYFLLLIFTVKINFLRHTVYTVRLRVRRTIVLHAGIIFLIFLLPNFHAFRFGCWISAPIWKTHFLPKFGDAQTWKSGFLHIFTRAND